MALAATASSIACGDLKSTTGEAADAGVEGGSADAQVTVDAAGRGAGPHGSLPSGYCCNDDSECRYRRCVDSASTGATGKMCLDECFSTLLCRRPDITFTCEQPAAGQRGLCKPPAGFACIPAERFIRGTLPAGACCNAGSPDMNDGTAGSACEGNQCAATGSGPLVCTNRCAFQGDCPDGFTCTQFGTSKACVPTSASYTCN